MLRFPHEIKCGWFVNFGILTDINIHVEHPENRGTLKRPVSEFAKILEFGYIQAPAASSPVNRDGFARLIKNKSYRS